eukprot:TRINITY_DN24769_c1_g2_i1.p1 TRINITY_DN24769_c1_g2~~TRINITY_DN24769_c1_g2_i1.p1  ORF type:complete len:722 (-),score=166.17 TRINITY_DN24769_c1_g2_i1:72-2237(-)
MEPILTDEERYVDACVLGTGLTESVLAAALARHGRRVLHLDSEETYGGNWRALSLKELERIAGIPPLPVERPQPAGATETEAAPAAAAAAAPASISGQGYGASAAPAIAEGQAEGSTAALPTPDRDISHLRAVDLEVQTVASCFCQWAGGWDPYDQIDSCKLYDTRAELQRRISNFSIDLVPRLLFGRCDMVDVLVESGVARYLEFQGLKAARILTDKGLMSVPLTKSDIFQDPLLTLPEKRMLMKFITSMSSFAGSLAFSSPAQLGVDNARKVSAPSEPLPNGLEGMDLGEPWANFLQKQKLTPRLQEFLTYAIVMWDWSPSSGGVELTIDEGLRHLGRFISSLGMYGRGTAMPLLYPMYGAAEVAQGFTRMCALHHGVYALRTQVCQVLVADDPDDSSKKEIAGLVTNRGEVVWARTIVGSCDHLLQKNMKQQPAEDGIVCKRMTVIVDCPLLSEEGLNMCVVPPSSLEPALTNVVQVLQLDWSTGTCPRGYYVVHLSQVSRFSSSSAREPAAAGDVYADLTRVLEKLLDLIEGGRRHCLFRCCCLHKPRDSLRWDPATEAGQLLSATVSPAVIGDLAAQGGGGLAVVADPQASPQLLAGQEIEEARELFLRTATLQGRKKKPKSETAETSEDASENLPAAEPAVVCAADFLRKPVHVAMEERDTCLEELEHFNEDMIKTEQAHLAPEASEALDAATADRDQASKQTPGDETAPGDAAS